MRRDADAKSAVERSKTDFYSKYSYLKPECEKNAFEHIRDGLQTAGEWCKEHWKLLLTVLIVVVAVVLLCTGVGSGLGAVLLAGACWGAIMGACIGGALGGVLCLTGQATIACAVDEGVSNLTGSEKSTAGEVWIKAFGGAATAAVFSKGFGKLSNNLSKNFSHIPELSRLSGKGSYGASFKMVTTKLKRGIIKNFTRKSVRNSIISELTGDIISDVVGGVNGAIDELGLLDEGKIVKKFLGYFYNNKAIFAF